ncbi:hypothetical protein [Faecalibacter rhinopitheci]|uniref:50S ribosomal protein L27 n=1 Tax=Faecalibacter rhinopitheci TaxID=2779678 RepID=A0A8J7K4I9_9FLAO|nr:hypothetical protein [Faecalibacter rhinopitheci]MBF0597634.1 hypothetical protein [Faecalibacter rhinopitheci]
MDFIKQLHSGWAYLTILMGVIFVVLTLVYAISKKDTDNVIKKIGLITTIAFHVQLLVGLVYYIMRFTAMEGAGNIMKSDILRFTFLEHPMMMIAAVAFMTIANAKLKRSNIVPMTVVIFALVSMACLLSRIPWTIWLG